MTQNGNSGGSLYYAEGFIAHDFGDLESSNPHEVESDEAQSWQIGWREAARELLARSPFVVASSKPEG